MSIVYIILGGNVGNREKIISEAIELTDSKIGRIQSKSSLYESEAWGFKSDLFINQVIIIKSDLSSIDILKKTQQIEIQLGRKQKNGSYQARTIDIDLLYIDDLIIKTPDLEIPHPRMDQRKFVLLPLSEVAPDKIHPINGLTSSQLLSKCKDNLVVRRLESLTD
jgi:2-amino-4-hydroxy-6-hydroxymethyldihydropteridine diphosphokinase